MTDKRKPPGPKQTIDESLRQVYREIDEEGVPDRFADLLKSLKAKDAGKTGQSND